MRGRYSTPKTNSGVIDAAVSARSAGGRAQVFGKFSSTPTPSGIVEEELRIAGSRHDAFAEF
jgi:hypothetical protein